MSALTGKTAVVTGAGRGIGAAIAARFADEGARVACFDLNPPEPSRSGLSIQVDVADEASVEDAVTEASDDFVRSTFLSIAPPPTAFAAPSPR